MRGFLLRTLVKLRLVEQPAFDMTVQDSHPEPEQLTSDNLVVVRGATGDKWTCFHCPGGCGKKVMLQADTWHTVADWLGRPWIHPSVRQMNDCRCHFWIRRGSTYWCRDSGTRPNFDR